MKAHEIRASLLMKGKTMKQFAEMIGTTRQNIFLVVHGRSRSKIFRAEIAAFLGRDVSELWPDSEPSTKEKAA